MNLKDIENLKSIKDFQNEMFNKTMRYQKIYGFNYNEKDKSHASWNNEADAFKHTFMQAVGALRYGTASAFAGGWLHEYKGNKDHGQPKGEENMDTWNNKVGREIANEVRAIKDNFGTKLTDKQIEDIVAAKIMERMKKGDLITNPNDKRDCNKDYDNYMKKSKETGYAVAIDTENIYYSLEDVGKMTSKEFSDAENVINRQMAENTMNNKQYFEDEVNKGNMIWVNDYIKDDGTKVKGYYRRK